MKVQSLNRTHILLAALLVFGALALTPQPALAAAKEAQIKPLLKPTTQAGSVRRADDPTIVRSRHVIVDVRQLREPDGQRLLLPLFDGGSLNLVLERRERVQTAGKEGVVWYGSVVEQPGGFAMFTLVNGAVAAIIRTHDGKAYEIRSVGGGVHALLEIDPSKFAPEGEPGVPPAPRDREGQDTCATDPRTDIDALIVYTDDARAAAGGTDAMEAEVFLAVAITNQSYVNSGVNQRLRLVHMAEVSYAETGNATTDRDRLKATADGFLDDVHTMRDAFAADVTALITQSETTGLCGITFVMDPVSNAFESSAFAVAKRSCAAANITLAHELAHQMSARHEWASDSTNSPFAFNHGFARATPTNPAVAPWRTIMATFSTTTTRLPYWSNPTVMYPPGDPLADPMGVTGASATDNRQALNLTASTVANFRCSSPQTGNVWMKDTWKDTGGEPDSRTAGEEMWKSPYIWVRRSQDPTLVKQHQHENPVAGQPSWVYVKLHNGGAIPAAGNLELYWANASTSLAWPGAWTLVTSIPVSGFAAHSTRIVEAVWTPPGAPGHYCMIARWVSPADPMTHAETWNIDYNSRYNNNIVWRNLNVVDLGGDPEVTASFIVRNNVDTSHGLTSLAIKPPKAVNEAPSFISVGKLVVRFDPVLMATWLRGGARGTGFTRAGDLFIVTDPAGAKFESIALGPAEEGRVFLTLRRLPATPPGRFVIDAVQYSSPTPAPPAPITGGVSYDIRLDADGP